MNALRLGGVGLAALTLCLCGPAVATKDGKVSPVISNDTLRIGFRAETGSPVSWRLRDLRGRQGEIRDLAGLRARHFRLSGNLAGRTLGEWRDAAGTWTLRSHKQDAVEWRLYPEGAPFALEQRWQLLNQPYRAKLTVRIENIGDSPLAGPGNSLRLQLGPGLGEKAVRGFGIAAPMYSYTEPVYQWQGEIHRFTGGSKFSGTTASRSGIAWAGLHSRYFALALAPADPGGAMGQLLVPDNRGDRRLDTLLLVELPLPELGAGESSSSSLYLFGGPKTISALSAGPPRLNDLLFYNLWEWMRWLALAILVVLQWLFALVQNWGVAIILLALLVRLVLHPFARSAIRAQQRFADIQAKLKPELAEIKQRYKGGEQSEQILQLYEKHNISPMAGIKPLLLVLIQIPVFVALFHLLGQAFDLRRAPFLWIETLSEPDRLFSFGIDLPYLGRYFNLLPALMALTTLLSFRLAPGPDQGSSRWKDAALGLITVGFFLLFYPFPSGMVLYWTIANALHLGHAVYGKYREAV